ncbi:aminopeptidase [Streptomyces hygroscopicus subsp. jinggangensis 5008]|nr:aminopeptidase [Streptomyces hygroscopicus subsp. jinggangensis 5008]AGF67706.1 aminopeptidase [Streptomyces hygroscopicus subsp. jinggangensis TL01]
MEPPARGLGRLFPAAFEAFLAGVPAEDRDGDLAAAYDRLLASADPEVRERAARASGPTGRRSLPAPPRSVDRFQDPVFRQGFSRTVTHYWGNGRFLGGDGGSAAERDGVVLRDAHRLKGIPGPWSRAASASAIFSAPSGGCAAPGRAASR